MMSISTRFGPTTQALSPPAGNSRAGIAPALDTAHGANEALEGGGEVIDVITGIALLIIAGFIWRIWNDKHGNF
jgi:hypothetical protein